MSDPAHSEGGAVADIDRPRTPLVVWLLVGAIAAAYVAYVLASRTDQIAAEYALAIIPERYHGVGQFAFHGPMEALAPLVGHAFLHVGWWHAALNAFFLLGASRGPALRLGAWRFLGVFFASVIGGGVAYLALNWNSDIAAVGASGGVCGMLSAYFLSARARWSQALADRRVRGPFAMLVFINVVVMGVAAEAGVFPIAWEAHLGGFVAGALAYVALERPQLRPWG